MFFVFVVLGYHCIFSLLVQYISIIFFSLFRLFITVSLLFSSSFFPSTNFFSPKEKPKDTLPKMQLLTILLSSISLLALDVTAIPTPQSSTDIAITNPETNTTTTITTFALPGTPGAPIPAPEVINNAPLPTTASSQLEARQGVTGLMRLCTDFNAGGRCADVTIPSSAIVTSAIAIGFSAFAVDAGQVCNLLGGCPSSAKILSPNNLDCGLSDNADPFTGCGFGQVHLDSLTGLVLSSFLSSLFSLSSRMSGVTNE